MDITKLSTDSLRNICEFFLEENLVSEEQLLQIAASRPSNELKRTVDFIHSCLCIDDHDRLCNYMSEEQRVECWTLPAHKRWLDATIQQMRTLQLSEQGLRQIYKEALCVLQDYMKLDANAKKAFLRMIAM